MVRAALFAIVCLALFAGHVSAAKCNVTKRTQSATLKSQTPKGCLVASIESGAFAVPVDATCLNDLVFNSTTLAADCNTSSVSVGFKNVTGCFEGEVATATQKTAKTGAALIKGSFEPYVPANFTGNVSADGNTMIVAVENVTCTLVYTVKEIAIDEPELEAEADEANTTAAAGAATEASAPSPSPAPKSAAAVITSLPAVALALVGTVLAAIAL